MYKDNITINQLPVEISISSAKANEAHQYSFDVTVNEQVATDRIRRVYHFDVVSITANYENNKILVACRGVHKLFYLNPTTEELVRPPMTIGATLPFEYKVTDDIEVQANIGNGLEMIGQYRLFKFLSEEPGVRVPQHVLNGMLGKLSRMPKAFGEANPLFIDRTYQTSFIPLECYKADYTLRQPLIAKVVSITNPTAQITVNDLGGGVMEEVVTELTQGSILFSVTDNQGALQYRVNGGSYVSTVNDFSISLSEGTYVIGLIDNNNEPLEFTITLTNEIV